MVLAHVEPNFVSTRCDYERRGGLVASPLFRRKEGGQISRKLWGGETQCKGREV